MLFLGAKVEAPKLGRRLNDHLVPGEAEHLAGLGGQLVRQLLALPPLLPGEHGEGLEGLGVLVGVGVGGVELEGEAGVGELGTPRRVVHRLLLLRQAESASVAVAWVGWWRGVRTRSEGEEVVKQPSISLAYSQALGH